MAELARASNLSKYRVRYFTCFNPRQEQGGGGGGGCGVRCIFLHKLPLKGMTFVLVSENGYFSLEIMGMFHLFN